MPVPNPVRHLSFLLHAAMPHNAVAERAVLPPTGCDYCGMYAPQEGQTPVPSCGAPKPIYGVVINIHEEKVNPLALETFVLRSIQKTMRL